MSKPINKQIPVTLLCDAKCSLEQIEKLLTLAMAIDTDSQSHVDLIHGYQSAISAIIYEYERLANELDKAEQALQQVQG